jgi:anti-anti-sigma regulatory factor
VVIRWKGEITEGETSATFKAMVLELLRDNAAVLVDLSDVTVLDRVGLGAMVSLYPSARSFHSSIRFENLNVAVSEPQSRLKVLKLAS